MSTSFASANGPYLHLFDRPLDPPTTRAELRARAQEGHMQIRKRRRIERMLEREHQRLEEMRSELQFLRRKIAEARRSTQGHAPRRGTNARAKGSRRVAGPSSPKSSDDPPGEPPGIASPPRKGPLHAALALMGAAEKRICEGVCGRDLDRDVRPPMRKGATVCREAKCQKAAQRNCERWTWDEQEHVYRCPGHGQDLQQRGRCKRCGKDFVPGRHVRQVDGLNLKADSHRIRGLFQRRWTPSTTGGSGGKLPGYGTAPWKGEWLPAHRGTPLVRDRNQGYEGWGGVTPTDPDTHEVIGGLVRAPRGWDYEDRLGDLDSTPGPDSRDADKFESLPYTYSRSEKRLSDQGARWNERPLCVRQTVPTTIEGRRRRELRELPREIVGLYAKGKVSKDEARARLRWIERASTAPEPNTAMATPGSADDWAAQVRRVKVAKLKASVADARGATLSEKPADVVEKVA